MADDARKQQVERKAQTPNGRHKGNCDATRRPACAHDRVEHAKQGQSACPAGIHNRRVAQGEMNQPRQEHHPADCNRSGQNQGQHNHSPVAGRSWLRMPQSTGTSSR